MTKDQSQTSAKRLPFRAWLIFGLTSLLLAISLGLRLAGYSFDRKSRVLIDGPMLSGVALSSLILATYRQVPSEKTKQEKT